MGAKIYCGVRVESGNGNPARSENKTTRNLDNIDHPVRKVSEEMPYPLDHRLNRRDLCKRHSSFSGEPNGVVRDYNARNLFAKFAIINAFPRDVALAMLDGRQVAPINKENVSIFFSSIVGFSSMSRTMEISKLTDMLCRICDKFDKLAYIHGVQKVDMIGDVYLAATNFVDDQSDDHAARLARFAIDAMKAARETYIDESDPEGAGCVKIQVGMHCGQVTGSILGYHNVKYTLMGDAVNTASRMMTTGLAGRIQCSEASAALIAEQASDMVLKERAGGVEAKGKGHMATFWMSSFRQGPHFFDSCPDLLRPPSRKGSLDSEGTASTVDALDLDNLLPFIQSEEAIDSAVASGIFFDPLRIQHNFSQYRTAVEEQTELGDAARPQMPRWMNWRSQIIRQ